MFVEIKYVIYVFFLEYCDYYDLFVEIWFLLNISVMCDYSVMFLLSRDNLDRDFVDVFLMFLGVEKVNWLSDMFFFGLL